jgi:hypothetical protein
MFEGFTTEFECESAGGTWMAPSIFRVLMTDTVVDAVSIFIHFVIYIIYSSPFFIIWRLMSYHRRGKTVDFQQRRGISFNSYGMSAVSTG